MSKIMKKKHVSRKTKASWRKNVDITDVENFLEEQREKERIGGDLSMQADEELFQIEKKPTRKIRSVRIEKKLRAQEPSKVFQSLVNNSKIDDPIKKRNRVRTADERKHPLTKAKIQRNKELGIIPERQLESLKDRIKAGNKIKKCKTNKIEFNKDLWADEDGASDNDNSGLNSEWVSSTLKQYHLKNTGDDVIKVPKISHEKRTQLKAIDKPAPGISYNPDAKDLNKLITSAVKKEEAIIKKEEKLNRILKPLYQKITRGEIKRRKREEMTQGFPINSDAEQDEDLTDGEYSAVNPPVRNKKKDLKQRRKQKESRLRNARMDKEKQELKKLKDLNTLKMFKKQINKSEETVQKKQKTRSEVRQKKKFEPHRLGRKKFEGEEVLIPESTESIGNLRKLKPEGNVLIDRFKSLQKRNILAPNVKRLPRKLRVTTVKKNSHKDEIQMPGKKKMKKASSQIKMHN